MNSSSNLLKGLGVLLLVCIVVGGIKLISCSGSGPQQVKEEKRLAAGKPDTSITKAPVSGTTVLKKVTSAPLSHRATISKKEAEQKYGLPVDSIEVIPDLKDSVSNQDSYQGEIKDSTFDLYVTATIDSTGMKLKYTGTAKQKEISRVDTLETTKTIVEGVPWYKTFYAGAAAATGLIVTVIYLIKR